MQMIDVIEEQKNKSNGWRKGPLLVGLEEYKPGLLSSILSTKTMDTKPQFAVSSVCTVRGW